MEEFLSVSHWVAGLALFATSVAASIHIVLYKRDSRSAIAWVGVIWLAPIVGCLVYFALGINRIQRKAHRLRKRRFQLKQAVPSTEEPATPLGAPLPPEAEYLAPLVKLVGGVTGRLLLAGNRVEALHNGEQAYPAMLQAIREAKQSVALSSYIFNNDRAGQLFVDALGQAVARGVAVRVLIDDIGGRYIWFHTAAAALGKVNVPVACFLPKLLPRFIRYANLCNHRKILVVDGRIGFTGGMNITEEHSLELSPHHPIQDVHFRISGPVVTRMQEVFVEDWAFSTGESLHGKRWFPEMQPCGPVLARGISSGPDADLEKLRLVFLGALACARSRVLIVTPYFLPDDGLISALNIAALRGVQVDILLPLVNDLRLVHWASMATVDQVLESGCKIWLTAPPFTHAKLMVVDGIWTLLGSANWDPRSMRLNFEFDVECYNQELAAGLEARLLQTLKNAKPLTLALVKRRPFLIKLRDGLARLLTPYL